MRPAAIAPLLLCLTLVLGCNAEDNTSADSAATDAMADGAVGPSKGEVADTAQYAAHIADKAQNDCLSQVTDGTEVCVDSADEGRVTRTQTTSSSAGIDHTEHSYKYESFRVELQSITGSVTITCTVTGTRTHTYDDDAAANRTVLADALSVDFDCQNDASVVPPIVKGKLVWSLVSGDTYDVTLGGATYRLERGKDF